MSAKQAPEIRRQAIIDAAVAVFVQHGFAAATTDQIARAAGLSKGGLYWHFKSKDEILSALLLEFFDRDLLEVREVLAGSGSASERLRQFVAHSAASMQQFEQRYPIMLEFYSLAARDQAVREFLQKYYARYQYVLCELLQQGFTQGEFRQGNAQSAATNLIAVFEGLMLLRAINPAATNLDVQLEAAIDLLVRGLQ